MSTPTTGNNARRDFYERIGGLSMAPLWESLHQLVPPRPAPKYQAAHWDYDRVRPFLMESGSLITAKEAVRRVLRIANFGGRGSCPRWMNQPRAIAALCAPRRRPSPAALAHGHPRSESPGRKIGRGTSGPRRSSADPPHEPGTWRAGDRSAYRIRSAPFGSRFVTLMARSASRSPFTSP